LLYAFVGTVWNALAIGNYQYSILYLFELWTISLIKL
jgi:hypothetical protein